MEIPPNISPHTISDWKAFLQSHPHNTIFQSPEMFLFYQQVKNFEPLLYINRDKTGEIDGLLLAVNIREGKGLKGYFSSRVVIYGGPLIVKGTSTPVILGRLLEKLVKQTKNKSIFIQFRNFFEWNEVEKLVFKKMGFAFKDRLNLIVNTEEEKRTWLNMSESRRRQIRKGLKSDVEITDPENENDVKAFYGLLVHLYKYKVKKPLPDESFFTAFYRESKKGKLGVIKLIKLKQKIIGGILSPVTPGKNIYEWYVVGLDKRYKKQYPSVLAIWAPIEYALNHHLSHFDFMGLGTPDKAYGVREFKKKFGGQMVNYGRFARRNNKNLYRVAELGYNLFRWIK